MKEFEVRFVEGLKGGLRKFSTGSLNKGQLVECHNLAPMETGLEAHEAITLIGAAADFFLLKEDGGYLLLESGGKIII